MLQHMSATGEDKSGRHVVFGNTAFVQRPGFLGDMHLLRSDVLLDQRRPGRRRGAHAVRHDGRQEDGVARLHRLRVLGAHRVLRRHRTSRLPADRRVQDQNTVGVLLSVELLR